MKKLLIALLFIIAIVAVGYFGFRYRINNFFEKNADTQNAATSAERIKLIADYNKKLLREMSDTASWQKFENQYFSVSYPQDWTINKKSDLEFYIMGPKVKLPYQEGFSGKSYAESVVYSINFKTYIPTSKYDLVDAAIQKGNLREYIDTDPTKRISPDIKRLNSRAEIFTLNGKEGFIEVSDTGSFTLDFLTKGALIEISSIDVTDLPLPEYSKTDSGLINIIKDRAWTKVIETILIK